MAHKPDHFTTSGQERLFSTVIAELDGIGYRGALLQKNYAFPDYFLDKMPERTAPAAAFGQTPPSYDTACFAVLLSARNGKATSQQLIHDFRALGAPFHLEVKQDAVDLWVAGRTKRTTKRIKHVAGSEIVQYIRSQKDLWAPEELLRAKNISASVRPRQLDILDLGLIPALEAEIRDKLDPILANSLTAAMNAHFRATGNKPDGHDLFRLTFRMLAGKIFYDRKVDLFTGIGSDPGPNVLLKTVAAHYRIPQDILLSDAARDAVYRHIWSQLDFRNLSIAVLTHIWSTTLVTTDVRQTLGIHATPRSIAKYIVDKLPFEPYSDLQTTDRLVIEPCSGSATFLVEALQRIRDLLPRTITERERHSFFQSVLVGFEKETFGVEIGRLCLTLADFPNPNGWALYQGSVFSSNEFPTALRHAHIVLCNPPFEDLDISDPLRAQLTTPHKPVEILLAVLANLHPDAVLGFVLPRQFLDGVWYRAIREQLAKRFATIEIVSLPDSAFRPAQHEAVLLLATRPRNDGNVTLICHRKVWKRDWQQFRDLHIPSSEDSETKTVAAAVESMAVTELNDLWSALNEYPKLKGIVDVMHRGIEWNVPLLTKGRETGNRERLVVNTKEAGYRLGVPPLAKLISFVKPAVKFLSMKADDEKPRSYNKPWDRPKVIMNAKRRSRGPWRVAAFGDTEGLVFYQTFTGVWPKDPLLLSVLVAILNGPLANAYIATREGSDITNETLFAIPIPRLSKTQIEQIDSLVAAYIQSVSSVRDIGSDWTAADMILRRIDAAVLMAYDLPPRLERKLLDFFRRSRRHVGFEFADYFPDNFKSYFSLAEYISPEFRQSTASEFKRRRQRPSEDILSALRAASHEANANEE